MTKKRDVIISSGKGSPITIGKKERRTDLLPEHQKDYEETHYFWKSKYDLWFKELLSGSEHDDHGLRDRGTRNI